MYRNKNQIPVTATKAPNDLMKASTKFTPMNPVIENTKPYPYVSHGYWKVMKPSKIRNKISMLLPGYIQHYNW